MKRIFFIFLLFVLFIVFVAQLQRQPFQISDDMAISSDYVKRLPVDEKDPVYDSIHYTDKSRQFLRITTDKDLQPIRCSDSFIRTEQGIYILENKKVNYRYTRRTKNEKFIGFMRDKERELPKGKKILNGKVCETEDKTLLLFYSIGSYDFSAVDTTNIRKAILYSKDNNAYIQIFPSNLFTSQRIFEIAKSKVHIRCDKPFQVSKSSILSVFCSEEEDWLTSYYVYQINLQNGSSNVLEICRNRFENFQNELVDTSCN